MEAFLHKIMPYMKEKLPQAHVVLELRHEPDVARRRELAQELKDLKRPEFDLEEGDKNGYISRGY